jgi:TP901 family phage tail tape measure protein
MQATGLAMTKFLTVPLVALGAVSTKMALDFDTTFRKIDALAGDIGVSTADAKERVKELAHATGQDPGGLAEALYFTASAGLQVEKVFPVLKASARAAASGMGDASTNARLLTTVLHDYEGTGLGAANAMNILTQAIKVGKAEPAEFAENIGVVIPLASQLGVSFQDVAAAIAQASNAGVEVSRATTGLRFLLSALQNPTEESKKVFEEFGVSLQDIQNRLQESGGLLEVMQSLADTFDITSVAGKAAWGTITGGARGAVIANTLVGNSAESARLLWEKLGQSAKDTSTLFVDAFAIMKQRPEFKFDRALADLKVAAIELGETLIPILIHDVIPAIQDVVHWFTELGEGTRKTIVQVGLVAAAFGPLLAVFGSILRIGGSVASTLFNVAKAITGIGTAQAATAATGKGGTAATAAGATAGSGFVAGLTNFVAQASPALIGAFGEFLGPAFIFWQQNFEKLGAQTEDQFNEMVQGLIQQFEESNGAIVGSGEGVANNIEFLTRQYGLNAAALKVVVGQNVSYAKALDLISGKFGVFKGILALASTDQGKLGQELRLTAQYAKDLGLKLTPAQAEILQTMVETNNLSGALRVLRKLSKIEIKANADTAQAQGALDALKSKMIGLGFKQTGEGWLASAKIIVHATPNSPWPWEIIEDGLKRVGFTKRDGGGGGDAAFFMKTIIEVHADFSHVQERLQTLIPLIREAAGEGAADQARAFARDLKGLEKQFDRLKQKALDFRDAIKGAFSDAADLIGTVGDALSQFASDQAQFLQDQQAFQEGGGVGTAPTAPNAPDISALIKAQVAQAQQLASLLKKLQSQGLNVANLTQIAGQGEGAIPIAQALLDNPELIQQMNQAQEQIANITQQTADKMTQAAFGDKLLKMSGALDTLLGRLNHFLDGLRPEKINDKNQEFVDALDHLIHAINNATGRIGGGGGGDNVTINVSGGSEQTGRDVRDALLQLKRRNLTTGL